MHCLLVVLLFHIVLQSVESTLTLKAQSENQVIMGLAEVQEAKLGCWSLKLSYTEVAAVNGDKTVTKDPVACAECWRSHEKLKFQFIKAADVVGTDQGAQESEKPWIDATINKSNQAVENEKLEIVVKLMLNFGSGCGKLKSWNALLKFLQPPNPILNCPMYYDYATYEGGVMLILDSIIKFPLFNYSIVTTNWLVVQKIDTDVNKNASSIALEFDNLAEGVPNYDIVFMKYVTYSVQPQQTSMIINNENGELYFSSKCYIKFSEGGVEYIANGGIILFKEVTARQIWIESVWASGKYRGAVGMMDILEKVHTCKIARREKSNKTPGESLDKKQWITLNVENNIRINRITNRVVTTFNFGTQKRLRYGGNRLTNMPVFVDTSKNQLTLMGTDLTEFETYRMAVSEAKAKAAKSKQNPSATEGVKVELLEANGDQNPQVGMKLFIPDSITANVGTKNPFGFPIFQYNYTAI